MMFTTWVRTFKILAFQPSFATSGSFTSYLFITSGGEAIISNDLLIHDRWYEIIHRITYISTNHKKLLAS